MLRAWEFCQGMEGDIIQQESNIVDNALVFVLFSLGKRSHYRTGLILTRSNNAQGKTTAGWCPSAWDTTRRERLSVETPIMDDISLVLLIKAESHRRNKGEKRLSFDPMYSHARISTYPCARNFKASEFNWSSSPGLWTQTFLDMRFIYPVPAF